MKSNYRTLFSYYRTFGLHNGHRLYILSYWRHTDMVDTYLGINEKKRPIAIISNLYCFQYRKSKKGVTISPSEDVLQKVTQEDEGIQSG